MSQLSVFMIVQNEATDLPGCLASLRGLSQDLIIVDGGSRDATVQIARDAGARVFERTLDGFAAQKQYALDQCRGDWLLSVDADERVTPELAEAIRQAMADPQAAAGYALSRRMYFLGRRLRFGGVGSDRVVRLFQRGKGRFRAVRVHERLDIDGVVRELPGALDHFSYASLDEYLEKTRHYTTLASEDLYARGRRFHIWDHARPVWELFQRLVLKGAWLDGTPGLLYAALSAHSSWLRAIKLWELQKNS